MVGRPSTFDFKQLKEIFPKYQSDFTSGIKPPKHDVWHKLAADLNQRYSAKNLYTVFKTNRGNILQELEIHFEPKRNDCSSETGRLTEPEVVASSDEEVSPSKSLPEKEFVITLSAEEWQKIQPKETVYKCSDKTNPLRLTRTYLVSPPENGWTKTISSHFWEHVKSRCLPIFKRLEVHPNGTNFLRIRGQCNECKSVFEGRMEKEPLPDSRALITCTYSGNYESCQNVRKRKIRATEAENILNDFIHSNETAKSFRGKLVNCHMSQGDPEPSLIPSLNALRLWKSRILKKEQLHEDPINALHIMKYCNEFHEVIHAINLEPFCLMYWTPSQVSCYNIYCDANFVPSICIDATGGVVHRLQRPFRNKSRSIFLYSIYVYDLTTESQYSIANMLSERHDTLALKNFLDQYFNAKSPVQVTLPKQSVSDHSIVLLSALVQTLTQFSSLNDYLINCAHILTDRSKFVIPTCFIRCDVAHTVKIIASFAPLKKMINKRCRQIYIRSLCQIILSESIYDIRDLLFSIFVVAVNPYAGKDNNGEPLISDLHKEKLKQRCGTGEKNEPRFGVDDVLETFPQYDDTATTERSEEEIEIEEIIAMEEDACGMAENNSNSLEKRVSFKKWGEQILEEANETVIDGDGDNAMYLPDLPSCILVLLERLPLWSAVMIPEFGYGERTATTAPVESGFNDLKNRQLGHLHLPIRPDTFLMHHVPNIESSVKLIQANNIQVNAGASAKKTTEIVEDATLSPDTATDDSVPASNSRCCKICGKEVQIEVSQSELPAKSTKTGEENVQELYCTECSEKEKGCKSPVDDPMSHHSGPHVEENNIPGDESGDKENNISVSVQQQITSKPELQPCPACAMGNLPTENAHKCVVCGKGVHIIFPQCGVPLSVAEEDEGYGQKARCASCDKKEKQRAGSGRKRAAEPVHTEFTTNGNFVTVTEKGAEENWKGQNPLKKSKRKRKSYLTPNIEILNYDLTSKRKPTPIGVLKNGNRVKELKPVKIDGKSYITSNTCSFDAIIQGLACGYSDSELYKSFVDSRPDEELIWKLVRHMEKLGVSQWPYRWRAEVLSQPPFEQVELRHGLTQIKAEFTVSAMCKKLLKQFPSVEGNIACSISNCCRTFPQTSISESFTAGANIDLGSVLKDKLTSYSVPCPVNDDLVHTASLRVPYSHIFFELQDSINVQETQKTDAVSSPILKLKDIPVKISADSKEYFLRCVVGFSGIGRRNNINSIGHYISYCRRIDNYWEMYDDFANTKRPCAAETKVECEFVMYTL